MPRFLQIRGVDRVPVTDPRAHSASPPRFVGQRRKVTQPTDPEADLVDCYEPVSDVVPDSPHLRAAIEAKELTQLGEPIVARDIDAARAMFAKASVAQVPALAVVKEAI